MTGARPGGGGCDTVALQGRGAGVMRWSRAAAAVAGEAGSVALWQGRKEGIVLKPGQLNT